MTELLNSIIPANLHGVIAFLYFGGAIAAASYLIARNVSDEDEKEPPINIELGGMM